MIANYLKNNFISSLQMVYILSFILFLPFFQGTLLAKPPPNSITPLSLNLGMSLEQDGDPVTGYKTVVIFFKSGNENKWSERYPNVFFENGTAQLTLGTQNSLYGDIFRVPTPSFFVSIESEVATLNIHTVPFTIFANTVESLDWSQIKSFPDLTNYSSHLNLKDVHSMSGLFIGETVTDQGNFRLTVGHDGYIGGKVDSPSADVGLFTAKDLFQNNMEVINQFNQAKFFNISHLETPEHSLAITSGNKWVPIHRDDVITMLELDFDPAPLYKKMGIGIATPNHFFDVGSMFNISKDRVRINNNIYNEPFSLVKGPFSLLVSENSLLINSKHHIPTLKSQLIVSGNINVNGNIYGYAKLENPEFNDLDFTVTQPKESSYVEENVIIHKMGGDVGIGAGYKDHPIEPLRQLVARLDITPFTQRTTSVKSDKHLLSVRNAYGPLHTQYLQVSGPKNNYNVGIHTHDPQGTFHVSSRPFTRPVTNTSLSNTFVVNNDKVGIGTTTQNLKLTIEKPKDYPALLIETSKGFTLVSQNGSIGINVLTPNAGIETKEGLILSESTLPKTGTIHLKNNKLFGQVTNNEKIRLYANHYWSLNHPHQYLTSQFMGIGTDQPTSSIHIHSSDSSLTIDTLSKQALTITPLGHVGINRSPTSLLSINGGMIVDDTDIKEEGMIRYRRTPQLVGGLFQGYTGTEWVSLGQENQWLYNDQFQSFAAPFPTKVGIMTDTPSASVHIKGHFLAKHKYDPHLLIVTNNGRIGINTPTPNALVQLHHISSDSHVFSVSGTQNNSIAQLNNVGFLGINELNPKEKVHISNGGLIITQSVTTLPGTLSFNNDRFIGYSNTKEVSLARHEEWNLVNNHISTLFPVSVGINNSSSQLYVQGDIPFSIRTDTNDNALHVLNNGNVGINLETPLVKMHLFSNQDPLMIDHTTNKRIHLTNLHHFGINITPRDTLDINGGIILGDSQRSIPGLFRYNPLTNLFEGYLDNVNQWATLSPYLQWQSNPDASLYYNEGNVGILTQDVPETLSVSGSLLVNSSLSGKSLVVNENGYIGVGSNQPKAFLHIHGNTSFMIDKDGDKKYYHPNAAKLMNFDIIDVSNNRVALGGKTTDEFLNLEGAIVIDKSNNQHPGSIQFLNDKFLGSNSNGNNGIILGQSLQWKNGTNLNKNDIYYPSGKVAIGTDFLSSLVTVKGNNPLNISSLSQQNALVANTSAFIGIWNSNPQAKLHIKSKTVPLKIEFKVPEKDLLALNPTLRALQEKPVISMIIDSNKNVGIER
tara:strand:+ start:768 stop:4580 length:3813 start_codon:yes stop_codon:yes gene_type:complete